LHPFFIDSDSREEAFRTQALILEKMAEGVSVCNERGLFVYTNPAFDQMFEYDRGDLLGRHVTLLNRTNCPETNAHIFQEVTAHLLREGAWAGEFENRTRNGRLITTLARISTLETAGRRYWVTVQEDVTERLAAERRLRDANRELDAFVYTLSHDLRSPLTAIIGFAELLHDQQGERLDEGGLEALEEIHRQSTRMATMMEDLLALAKVGSLPVPDQPVDTDLVVRETLLELEARFPGARKTVRLNPLPDMRIPPTFLAQVFRNLLGNALKYAGVKKGPIEIEGYRKGARVEILVRDHGPGISEGDMPRVFDVFYRGSAGRHAPGTGIGLAAVRKIARFYGGDARVEPTPGGGATFRVEIRDDSAS